MKEFEQNPIKIPLKRSTIVYVHNFLGVIHIQIRKKKEERFNKFAFMCVTS